MNRNRALSLTRYQLLNISTGRAREAGYASAHERLMFAAGYRKGFKAARRGDVQFLRARGRRLRNRKGDAAWADGFHAGAIEVPKPKGPKTPRKKKRGVPTKHVIRAPAGLDLGETRLTEKDLRQLKRRGRITR